MPSRPARRGWRLARQTLWASFILVAALLATAAPRDAALFPEAGGTRPVWLVDHGYHSGLIVARRDLVETAEVVQKEDPAAAEALLWIASRTPDANWVELGWGDAAFYRATPGVADIDPWLAVRALFWPTASVLQIVPLWGDPAMAFPSSPKRRLDLSDRGFAALARRLAATVTGPEDRPSLGPSLYGVGAFYPARLDYHLFRTCNHWIGWLLRAGGVPSSPLPAAFSRTLRWELDLRL